MNRPLPVASAILLALFTACASNALLPISDQAYLERELEGRALYLRSTFNVMPFFGDPDRRLASPLAPDAIDLLETPTGEPIYPGDAEKRLEVGTRVRIEKIEQPSSLVSTRRPLYTPRTLPWVYFSVVGEKYERPYVAVLRPGLKTREDFLRAFDALFTPDDPTYALDRFTLEVRQAIREKRLLPGMDPNAVELSWGAPEKIRISQEEGITTTVWTWPRGKRSASFRDDRLIFAHPPIE